MQQSSATPSLHLCFWGCGRLLHALNPPRSAFLFQQFLARCHPYILFDFYTCICTSIKIIKNEIGCRDDTVPKTVGTRRHCEEDGEHATIFRNPLPTSRFLGVAEDCCMLSILLAVPSCTYSFWHGVIPTSYFIFILVLILTIKWRSITRKSQRRLGSRFLKVQSFFCMERIMRARN